MKSLDNCHPKKPQIGIFISIRSVFEKILRASENGLLPQITSLPIPSERFNKWPCQTRSLYFISDNYPFEY